MVLGSIGSIKDIGSRLHVLLSTACFFTLDFLDAFLYYAFAVFDYLAGEPWEQCRYCTKDPASQSESRATCCTNHENTRVKYAKVSDFRSSFTHSVQHSSVEIGVVKVLKSSESPDRPCFHLHPDIPESRSQFHTELGFCCPSPTLARVKSFACTRALGHFNFNSYSPERKGQPGYLTHWSLKHSGPRVQKSIRWSDCHCTVCSEWEQGDGLLTVHTRGGGEKQTEGAPAGTSPATAHTLPSVLFLHGFLASSAFWTDTVLPHLPPALPTVAVDLLGFGTSPKPISSQYTVSDHIEAISKSVLLAGRVDLSQKFSVVGHSMGCILALAIAAAHPQTVTSVVLIAPPSVTPSPGESPSVAFFHQIAPRHLSSVLHLGISVMAWYEHIGRLICAILCCGHRMWDPLMKAALPQLTGRSVPPSFVTAFNQHTHHSAWHTFHNTICGGAQILHPCIERLREHGVTVHIIHGRDDAMCRHEGSVDLAARHCNVKLESVEGDHVTCVLGRVKQVAKSLASILVEQGGA